MDNRLVTLRCKKNAWGAGIAPAICWPQYKVTSLPYEKQSLRYCTSDRTFVTEIFQQRRIHYKFQPPPPPPQQKQQQQLKKTAISE
jgi:hypothetical protein